MASLSVLTLAVAAIAVTLSLRGCGGNSAQPETGTHDSITSVIETKLSPPDSLAEADSSKAKKVKKAKKKKAKAPRKQPKQRNHLDEPVNE